jgi:hypothetical protein
MEETGQSKLFGDVMVRVWRIGLFLKNDMDNEHFFLPFSLIAYS